MRVRKVAILGASGLVSQRFQQRLVIHPWLKLVAVVGSPRTAGNNLQNLEWHLPEARPDLPNIQVLSMDNVESSLKENGVEVVFSALPSEVAIEIEKQLANAGFFVFSNSSAHRMDADVPLIIADLNPHHLLPLVSAGNTQNGFLACSTNCTVVPAALALKPLWDFIGLNNASIRTEQSLSGGGIELLTTARVSGTVSEEIPGEAEKMHEECLSLLGRALPTEIRSANLPLTVVCKRVMREYGHIVHVEAELYQETGALEVEEWMRNYRARPQAMNLPSAPSDPLCFVDELLPENLEDPANNLRAGMEVRIANLIVEGNRVKFSAWSANTIRGAAGGTVLLAELALAEGLLGN